MRINENHGEDNNAEASPNTTMAVWGEEELQKENGKTMLFFWDQSSAVSISSQRRKSETKIAFELSSNLVSQIKTILMREGVEDEPYYF